MIRFSDRLKRKREEQEGQVELLLPQAKRVGGFFNIHVSCFMDGWHTSEFCDFHEEVAVTVRSDATVSSVLLQLIENLGLSEVDEVKVRMYKYRRLLSPELLLGNCNVGENSCVQAIFEPSADIGREFYMNGNYKAAAAHLFYALTNDLCHKGHYAAYYADICLRSLDGRERALGHAARWYLEATRSCDETVKSALKELSPGFAAKLDVAAATRDYPLVVLVDDLVAEWRNIDVQQWARELAKEIK